MMGTAFLESGEVRAALARRNGTLRTPSIEIAAAVVVTTPPIPPGTQVPPSYDYSFGGIAARLGQGRASAGAVPYLQETSVTNAAVTTGQGVAKAASSKALALKTEQVVKIAHTLEVPDELLDDTEALESYLNANMAAGLDAELDDQIVNGSGAAGNIQGLVGLPGKTTTVAAAAGEGMGAIAKAAADLWTASRRRPDTIVINPTTYNTIWFPTGNKAIQISPPPHNMTVVPTPALAAGSAIVGSFKLGGMIFRRGGVAIQATNSHNDFFTKNLTMIRAEVRVAVVYFAPPAFCLVTGIA
jgi:HK97 family phage major capsid protein